jgi:hypothetical protein
MRGRATTAACEEPALPSSLPVAAAGGDPPLPALSTPPHTSQTLPSPELLTPPAKRTRRRRNEVELLRDHEEDNELLLSPFSAPATPHTATLHASTPPTTPTTTAVPYTPTSPASWEDLPASPLLDAPTPTRGRAPDAPTLPTLPDSPLNVAPSPARAAMKARPIPVPTVPASSADPSPPASPSSNTPSSPPPLRAPNQEGWDLCMKCRRHYHHKMYRHCWFCNFK